MPSFSKLLNGTDVSVRALKELRNPRELHKFMSYLMKFMNVNVIQRSEKFITSNKDVNEALVYAKNTMVIDKCD